MTNKFAWLEAKSRWLWGAVAVLALGAGALVSAVFWPQLARSTDAERPAGADLPRVPTLVVERQDLKRTMQLPGSVEGYETADLYAKVGGYVDVLHVDIGDGVRGPRRNQKGEIIEPGQPLAELYAPEMYQRLEQRVALVEQAQAELDQAGALLDQVKTERKEKEAQRDYRQATYNRVEVLVRSNATVPERFEEADYHLKMAKAAVETLEAQIRTAEANEKTAKAKLAVAEADRDHARTLWQYATIRAPFDGVVTRRLVDLGNFVQPAEGNSGAKPLFTVTQNKRVRIFASLPMSDVRWVDADDTADVQVESLPGDKPFKARVVRFAPALDSQSRMMRVELALDKPDPRVIPGSYVYVTLNLADHPKTPVIPASALLTDAKGLFVYVVREGECQRQAITSLYEDGEKVGIESGLVGGEEIVRAGGGQLGPGQKVTPVRVPAPKGSP